MSEYNRDNILPLDETHFDCTEYLNTIYSPTLIYIKEPFWELNVIKVLRQFSDTLTRGSGNKGSKVLEFGGGPVLWPSLLLAQYFDQIYFCEYLQQNRQMVQDWLDKKPIAYDWKEYFDAIIRLYNGEQQQATSLTTTDDQRERWEEKLRSALCKGGIFQCDVNNNQSLITFDSVAVMPQFDMIFSSCCLEVCKTVEHYKQTTKRLVNLLRPGGLLLLNGVIDCNYYPIDDKKFYSLSINEKQVKEAFEESNMTDNSQFIFKDENDESFGGLYTIFAFKPLL